MQGKHQRFETNLNTKLGSNKEAKIFYASHSWACLGFIILTYQTKTFQTKTFHPKSFQAKHLSPSWLRSAPAPADISLKITFHPVWTIIRYAEPS